jgi:ABC-2 type transport system ATP-binding protein
VHVLSALRLTRRFGSRTAVEDVSFEVARSEVVALVGPNGAGKTTTMRMLAGLIAPTSGSVAIDGAPLTDASGSLLRRRIGFLTETPGLWHRLTVRENLRVYAGLYALDNPEGAIDRMLDTFELAASASRRAGELSKGMRQKVALARTLLHDPSVLLLDEPTSGLDPGIARHLWRLLQDRRAAGCAILVSTHNLHDAERLADRVAVLQGRLLAIDRPEALKRRFATGHVVVRLAGDAARHLPAARALDPGAVAEGHDLRVAPPPHPQGTPALVRALVEGGADILEVHPEMPGLEDVYLRLLGGDATTGEEPA